MRQYKDEAGFTLVELLVVIIIIGILAAVAIPAFSNQRQRAVDAATISDVKGMANAIQEQQSAIPNALWYGTGGEIGGFLLQVGPIAGTSNGPTVKVPATKGTRMRVEPADSATRPGEYVIYAYNPNGKVYNSDARVLKYESNKGGIQTGTTNKSGDSFGIAQ